MTNKRKKFTTLLITTLIITSILSIGCGTITNYVYEPKAGSMKWVTIDGEDFNPNTDNVAPMFPEKIEPIILAQTVSTEGNPFLLIKNDDVNTQRCIKWNGENWANLDDSPWYYYVVKLSSRLFNMSSPHDLIMQLDADNNPHIIWSKDATYGNMKFNKEVFYTRWDEDKWITANGEEVNVDSGNANVSKNNDSYSSFCPCLALDSKNIPHIVWNNSDYANDKTSEYRRVSYITWNGVNWVNGYDKKFISELEDSALTGNFSNAEISGDFSAGGAMILIDSKDKPCVFWRYKEYESNHCQSYYKEGVFIKKADDDWVTINGENWDPQLGNGRLNYRICDLASSYHFDLDTHNKPYLTWTKYNKSNGMFVSLVKGEKNIWKTINGDEWDRSGYSSLLNVFSAPINMDSFDVGASSIIKIDTYDNMHLLWHYNTRGYIKGKRTTTTHIFYGKWDGENWRTIDGQICDSSSRNYGIVVATSPDDGTLIERKLSVDDNGIPHIFWKCSGGSLNYIKGVQAK